MEITRHGKAQQTNGEPPMIGHQMPEFQVKLANGKSFSDQDMLGKYTLISVVPDINTRVCTIQTKNFNKSVDEFAHINFFTVSTNTAKQQQDWCAAENVKNMTMLSDEDGHFGEAFGLFTADNATDARSVWIIDPKGKIVYREIVIEQTQEPDYQSALAYVETHTHPEEV